MEAVLKSSFLRFAVLVWLAFMWTNQSLAQSDSLCIEVSIQMPHSKKQAIPQLRYHGGWDNQEFLLKRTDQGRLLYSLNLQKAMVEDTFSIIIGDQDVNLQIEGELDFTWDTLYLHNITIQSITYKDSCRISQSHFKVIDGELEGPVKQKAVTQKSKDLAWQLLEDQVPRLSVGPWHVQGKLDWQTDIHVLSYSGGKRKKEVSKTYFHGTQKTYKIRPIYHFSIPLKSH
ncbi:hypothetical protein KFE98_12990 [bacterium SCSIO 12741]|nr:hypothetical protein KFE98_12990 [bacterium SCSIO 12741]